VGEAVADGDAGEPGQEEDGKEVEEGGEEE